MVQKRFGDNGERSLGVDLYDDLPSREHKSRPSKKDDEQGLIERLCCKTIIGSFLYYSFVKPDSSYNARNNALGPR